MDNFAEQLVKRENLPSDNTRKTVLTIGSVLGVILLALIMFLTLGSFIAILALILIIVTIIGTIKLLDGFKVEYEYTITNGELDIDKIIAQKKRKSLITINAKKITEIGLYDENTPDKDNQTIVLASDNIDKHEYYADCTHDEYGNVRLIFSPNERMLEAIKIYLPLKVRNELEKDNNES